MPVRGGTVDLSATFYDAGNLEDPTTAQLRILFGGSPVATYAYPGPITHAGLGLLTYTWTIPGDAAYGTYVAEWSADLGGGTTIGYETFQVSSNDFSVATGDAYCTLTEARAAGAVGPDAQVVEAIAMAVARVDAFCQDRFTPRPMTVVARVGGDGRAMLPFRLTATDTVTEVTDPDTDVVLNAGTYRAFSSAVTGEVDAIGIGQGWVGTNLLVVGLEPYADTRVLQERVKVTATFGWADTPTGVEMATAMLAADISRTMVDPNDATPASPGTVDPEGNVIPVVPPFESAQEPDDAAVWNRTTGNRRADALLIPYRRDRVFTAV